MKPMLAANVEMSEVRYPVLASAKVDGVRGMVIDGQLRSRSLKAIPCQHANALFGRPELNGFDGELIVGSPTAKDVFRVTSGALAHADWKPEVVFYVFDLFSERDGFADRLKKLIAAVCDNPSAIGSVKVLEQRLVHNEKELLAFEAKMLAEGYEGLILRHPNGVYKQGRSTVKEGGMLKLKRFQDSEAVILEVVEEMENTNVATTNALGHSERSGAQSGMRPKGRAGALSVRDVHTGVEFNIGSGFDAADRDYLWKHRTAVVGKMVKYKSFLIGVKDAPRFPVYLGGREAWDL
jgi:DNA ligase-1